MILHGFFAELAFVLSSLYFSLLSFKYVLNSAFVDGKAAAAVVVAVVEKGETEQVVEDEEGRSVDLVIFEKERIMMVVGSLGCWSLGVDYFKFCGPQTKK